MSNNCCIGPQSPPGGGAPDVSTATGILPVSKGGTGDDAVPAHYALLGPTSGADAAPTWRAIESGDLPGGGSGGWIEVQAGVQAGTFAGTFALSPGNVDANYPFGSAQTTYTSYICPTDMTLKHISGLPIGANVTLEVMRYESGSWVSKATLALTAGSFGADNALNIAFSAGDNLCLRAVCASNITALWAYFRFQL